MSNNGHINDKEMNNGHSEQTSKEEQESTSQRLLRLQHDIEGQGQKVAAALNPIVEALERDRPSIRGMVSHLKAQILLAHLQLDDLEELLNSIE